MSMQQLVNLYMENIIKLYGTSAYIVTDKDPRLTSRVWKEYYDAMGKELKFITTFHPQTNKQSKTTIQVLEDLL